MRTDSPKAAGKEKSVALEDSYLITISGLTKLPFSGETLDEKCFAAPNPGPLLDLVQRGWALNVEGEDLEKSTT